MSKFKVGDRVRKVGCEYLRSFLIGEELVVVGFSIIDNVWVARKMEDYDCGLYDSAYDSDLELIYSYPAETITQNGYEYRLVDPVVPEWVKDGAWVVRKDNGETHQINQKSENSFSATSSLSRVTGLTAKRVAEEYRPFTKEDWKWGMWAMYEGKRVFVMNGVDPIGCVEISGKPITYTTLSGWNMVYNSELTPTF